ncbi:MAG: DUF4136 domain-containing protein [Leptospirales bacterium]
MQVLIIGLVMVLLTSCGLTVRSNVTVFSQLSPNDIHGKQIALLPDSASLLNSLEFSTYKAKLTPQFQKIGFIVVNDPHAADYLATIHYGIDKGRLVTKTYSSPLYGFYGGGTTYGSGTFSDNYGGGGSYNSLSQTTPTFGITGSHIGSRTVSLYTRFLAIEIVDRRSIKDKRTINLYEGRVVSTGSCPSMAGVFDPMAKALFQNFFAENGSTKTVIVSGAHC